jgi:hypothetical protein
LAPAFSNVIRHFRQSANLKNLKKSALKKISRTAVDADLAHSSVILEITGIDDAALRRLSAKGIIAKPKLSKWPLRETLQKLFAYQATEKSGRLLPVFDSMDACAGAGVLSKPFLQTLKSFGLPGFQNSRVDLNEVIPAIETFFAGTGESHAELKAESVSSYKDMREKYNARLARIEFLTAEGEVILKLVAVDTLREMQVIHYHSYDRMIEEWPSILAGESAAKIRLHLVKQVGMLKTSEENSINALEKYKPKRKPASHD